MLKYVASRFSKDRVAKRINNKLSVSTRNNWMKKMLRMQNDLDALWRGDDNEWEQSSAIRNWLWSIEENVFYCILSKLNVYTTVHISV